MEKTAAHLGWMLFAAVLVQCFKPEDAVHFAVNSYSAVSTTQRQANSVLSIRETIREVQWFHGDTGETDHFKTLLIEGGYMVIGAKNMIYNISLSDMKEQWHIEWKSSQADKQNCINSQQSAEECQNHIRVIQRQQDQDLFICGTNAYNPYCRTYRVQHNEDGKYNYFTISDQIGKGKTPFDPKQNNTALLIDERLYTATASDRQSLDDLILGITVTTPNQPPTLRTQQYEKRWLNEPNPVHSFQYEDKVYFLFSETAVEYMNCGKKIYSRVGRVCKNDQGGKWVLRDTWSSFFKARLNCSIPGDFPFYFDEIQSASELGQGNYMPSLSTQETSDMFYAVFNTPANSIHGSAVCAFRMSDVAAAFEGAFKGQIDPSSNWLPVSERDTPHPHPAKTCSNDSTSISDVSLTFIRDHPLMDEPVKPFGGQPIFIQASSSYRLTKIAIDWQVPAADGRSYDVIYSGTNDGRVIKTVNHGASKVDTAVIEDIEVFHDKSPVIDLKVHRDPARGESKLVVVSASQVKAIPLQRCHIYSTCSECVALQDPYCAWHEGRCMLSRIGLQSISNGEHHQCPDKLSSPRMPETTTAPVTCPACPVCATPAPSDGDEKNEIITPKPSQTDSRMMNTPYEGPTSPKVMCSEIPNIQPRISDSRELSDYIYTSKDMALAVVFSVLLSLLVGFLLGVLVTYIRMRMVKTLKAQQTSMAVSGNNCGPKMTNIYDDTGSLQKRHNEQRATENYNVNIDFEAYKQPEKPSNNVKFLNNDLKAHKPLNDPQATPRSTHSHTGSKMYI